MAYIGCSDGIIIQYDTSQLTAVKRYRVTMSSIAYMCVSSSKFLVAVGDYDGVTHMLSLGAHDDAVVNEKSQDLQVPTAVDYLDAVDVDDESFKFSSVPLPHNDTPLLSQEWPRKAWRYMQSDCDQVPA